MPPAQPTIHHDSLFKCDAANLGEQLTNDQILLLEQMVEAYSKLAPATLQQIKERQSMRFVANTITEHYEHLGEQRGELRGKIQGLHDRIRVCRDQLQQLEAFLAEGKIAAQVFMSLAHPLKMEISEAEAELKATEPNWQAQSA